MRHLSQAGPATEERYSKRAEAAERHAEVLRQLLVTDAADKADKVERPDQEAVASSAPMK